MNHDVLRIQERKNMVRLVLLTPGSSTLVSPHFGTVPRFLAYWYVSLPPGVLTLKQNQYVNRRVTIEDRTYISTRLDFVLYDKRRR